MDKNTRFLSQIARRLPDFHFAWIGGAPRHSRSTPLWIQASSEPGKQLIGLHDFMITVGKADANPTTILEAMAWGLIPVCPPQSGYVDCAGIINIPLDIDGAIDKLREMQTLPDERLREMQAANWEALDKHFNWDRFAGRLSKLSV